MRWVRERRGDLHGHNQSKANVFLYGPPLFSMLLVAARVPMSARMCKCKNRMQVLHAEGIRSGEYREAPDEDVDGTTEQLVVNAST